MQAGGELDGDRQRLLGGERAVAAEARGQGLAAEQLHVQEWRALRRLDHVEDATDVGMGHAVRELDLAAKPLERARVTRDLGADGLERDAIVEQQVFGLVDLAHAALGDEAHDLVASGPAGIHRDAAWVHRPDRRPGWRACRARRECRPRDEGNTVAAAAALSAARPSAQ